MNTVIKILFMILCAIGFGSIRTVAFADTLNIKFNNQTGQSISSIAITPKSGGSAQSILTGALAASAIQSVQFTPASTDCVYNISYTTAAGITTTVPDTDLCQTEQLILQ